MLYHAILINHSSHMTGGGLLSHLIAGEIYMSTDISFIVDGESCQLFHFDCTWPMAIGDYVGCSPQSLQHAPRRIMYLVGYWQLFSTQHHEGSYCKGVWSSPSGCFRHLAILCLIVLALGIKHRGLQ
jgi:hypothetical protein